MKGWKTRQARNRTPRNALCDHDVETCTLGASKYSLCMELIVHNPVMRATGSHEAAGFSHRYRQAHTPLNSVSRQRGTLSLQKYNFNQTQMTHMNIYLKSFLGYNFESLSYHIHMCFKITKIMYRYWNTNIRQATINCQLLQRKNSFLASYGAS